MIDTAPGKPSTIREREVGPMAADAAAAGATRGNESVRSTSAASG
ncbi:hypothetical protein [Streptomyces barkulensis]|nr:hypothetical protein [Streptomyces barkulensis]